MKAEYFIKSLRDAGLAPFTGVPDSIFLPLINYFEQEQATDNYICSSEGEAMGLAGGFALAGRTPIVYMQNDGYGNAVNPLSSLQLMNKLPALLLISWRAEPGQKDEPQHDVMGETIQGLLDLFNIPHLVLDAQTDNLEECLTQAQQHFQKESTPFAFIIRKGTFDEMPLPIRKKDQSLDLRYEYIKDLEQLIDDDCILLGTTGYCGREIYQLVESPNKFYMMGSMGCLASVGLGIAKEYPNKTIFALDGDGAILMKMGTLSTIGYHQPKNFIHINFDNAQYESTGGQPTTSSTTNFIKVAEACGYRTLNEVRNRKSFQEIIKARNIYENPHFIDVKIRPGTIENLQRPKTSPEQMKKDLREALNRKNVAV